MSCRPRYIFYGQLQQSTDGPSFQPKPPTGLTTNGIGDTCVDDTDMMCMTEIDTTDQHLEALKHTSYMVAIAKDFGKNLPAL